MVQLQIIYFSLFFYSTVQSIAKSPKIPSSTKRDYENHPPYLEFTAKTRVIFQEVLDLASGKHEVDTSEELLVSAVKALKSLLETGSCSDEELKRVLDHGMETIYSCSLLDPNPGLRGRILRGLTGQIKLWHFIVRQPEVHTGDVDAISRRIWRTDVAGDQSFDITDVIPAGGMAHLLRQTLGVFDPPISMSRSPSESREEDNHPDPLDEMPLD